jgi:aerobic-type carbon monoxide dehydrogenase small subunit (CoxS/CutS family)
MGNVKVNGVEHQVDADPNMPLLWVLRDILNLTGTKFGCGKGLCGACTIHLNGQPVRSCLMPLSVAAGAELTTIEGLSESGDHPLQKAWFAHKVPQCGYCQAGQLMSAAALLNQNKNPSDAEIQDAMSGNICRCGTYPRIEAAIKSVARAHDNLPAKPEEGAPNGKPE